VKPIRVLVAEDSRTERELLCALLREDGAIEIVATAVDGVEAVEAARALRPDVITMDVQMPRLGGLEAIDRIMEVAPSRILVVCSVGDEHQVDLSFRTVAAGALELIAKPRVEGAALVHAWGRELCRSVHLMAEIPVVRRRRSVFRNELAVSDQRLEAVGLVASTGGPPALALLLGSLPTDLPVPVLIAQHMAPGFAQGLVRWLGGVTRLEVCQARHGAPCAPGHVYLPPDGHDLAVDRRRQLVVRPAHGVHCPSANVLLTSLAEAYGSKACAVVLTGMGDDGAEGVKAIRARGGVCLAQDNASCIVFGMPRAAIEAGAIAVLMAQLASTVRDLCVERATTT
jgi:two-component system chemotaxis response regulator CheB